MSSEVAFLFRTLHHFGKFLVAPGMLWNVGFGGKGVSDVLAPPLTAAWELVRFPVGTHPLHGNTAPTCSVSGSQPHAWALCAPWAMRTHGPSGCSPWLSVPMALPPSFPPSLPARLAQVPLACEAPCQGGERVQVQETGPCSRGSVCWCRHVSIRQALTQCETRTQDRAWASPWGLGTVCKKAMGIRAGLSLSRPPRLFWSGLASLFL